MSTVICNSVGFLVTFMVGCLVGTYLGNTCQCIHLPEADKALSRQGIPLRNELEESGWIFTSQLGNYMSYFILQEYWRAPIHGGVFIEFGCADGITNSNTYFFERYWGWTGLCIEVHPIQYQEAVVNRPNSQVLNLAIGGTNQDLEFWYLTDQSKMVTEQWSGISEFFTPEYRIKFENKSLKDGFVLHKKPVSLVNLTSLLDSQYADIIKAPRIGKRRLIDYLSIDCEGCEYEALLGVDFTRYVFSFITVELDSPSGRSRNKQSIYKLLLENGYEDTNAGSVDPLFKYNWDAHFKSGKWPWMIDTRGKEKRKKSRGGHKHQNRIPA